MTWIGCRADLHRADPGRRVIGLNLSGVTRVSRRSSLPIHALKTECEQRAGADGLAGVAQQWTRPRRRARRRDRRARRRRTAGRPSAPPPRYAALSGGKLNKAAESAHREDRRRAAWYCQVIFTVLSSVLRHDESVPASPGQRRRPEAGAGRRRASARVRRRRTVVATVAVVVVAVVAWFAILPHGGTSTHGTAAAPVRAAAAPPVLDAAESGLLPWHLAAPLSREVVVPGSPGQLIVLGGLTPAWHVGQRRVRAAHGHRGGPADRRAPRSAARWRRGDLRRAGAGLRGRIAGHRGHGPGVLRRWHRPRDGIAARAAVRRRGGQHRRHRLRRGRLRREQARRLGAGHRRTAGPSPRWQRCRFRCAILPSPPWTARSTRSAARPSRAPMPGPR